MGRPARRHLVVVLHDDADFETVARVVARFQQERLTA
jgi:hypothetical protein